MEQESRQKAADTRNGKVVTVRDDGTERVDYLYRLSLKALIYNEAGQVLVVKEIGRPFWDLPGGGMDFDETIEMSLKRELLEEVGYQGNFRYQVFDMSEQIHIQDANVVLLCVYCRVWPDNTVFTPGEEGDAVKFIDPEELPGSGYNPTDRAYTTHVKWQQLCSTDDR